MIAPQDALERLRAGNARFVQGAPNPSPQSRLDALGPQRPFAAVLGCSDSRCPVEAIFDQGFGELFVVRVAGNVADATQVGSLEFAVQGTRRPAHTRARPPELRRGAGGPAAAP